MARFNLNKGERFKLDKSAGLNNITVELGWVVPKGKRADLDASAFLLGEDGVILDDADYVFYNSDNRSEQYDRQKFGNKKHWRELTVPVSKDGSVVGSIDDIGEDEEEENNDMESESSEEMHVDLSKVDSKITEIVFCVTVYYDPKIKNMVEYFGEVKDPYISIINDEDGEELCRYNLREKFKSEDAVVAGSLLCNEDGEWSFEAQGKGYDGGMQTLIDIYA